MSNTHYDTANRSNKPVWLATKIFVPTAGQSLVIPDGTRVYLLQPAATLATLNVKFPAKPYSDQIVTISTTQDITLLTLQANTGQIISGAPAASLQAANTAQSWMYSSISPAGWYKV